MAEQDLGWIIQRQTLLTPTKNMTFWRAMIAHVQKGHGTWEKSEIHACNCECEDDIVNSKNLSLAA